MLDHLTKKRNSKEESIRHIRVVDEVEIPQGFISSAKIGLRRYGLIGSLSRYLMLIDENRKFVERGASDSEKAFRASLLRQFGLIQKSVACAHSPYQFVLMAEYLLSLKSSGPIIQCGCFKGGCTAKLSILAKKLNRKLYVCDSFSGLPAAESEEEMFLQGHGDHPNNLFSRGQYEGTLQEVKGNIKKYGCIDVCEFVPGLFEDTLKNLEVAPAFVFIDVDYVSSAQDCLKYLWPRLQDDGYWFTHEAIYFDYIRGILDPDWWMANLQEYPPVVMGGGYGLSALSPVIAYFRKTPRN